MCKGVNSGRNGSRGSSLRMCGLLKSLSTTAKIANERLSVYMGGELNREEVGYGSVGVGGRLNRHSNENNLQLVAVALRG